MAAEASISQQGTAQSGDNISGGAQESSTPFEEFENAFPEDGIQKIDSQGRLYTEYGVESRESFLAQGDNRENAMRYWAYIRSACNFLKDYTRRVPYPSYSNIIVSKRPIHWYAFKRMSVIDPEILFQLLKRGIPVQAAAILGMPDLEIQHLYDLPRWESKECRSVHGNYFIIIKRVDTNWATTSTEHEVGVDDVADNENEVRVDYEANNTKDIGAGDEVDDDKEFGAGAGVDDEDEAYDDDEADNEDAATINEEVDTHDEPGTEKLGAYLGTSVAKKGLGSRLQVYRRRFREGFDPSDLSRNSLLYEFGGQYHSSPGRPKYRALREYRAVFRMNQSSSKDLIILNNFYEGTPSSV